MPATQPVALTRVQTKTVEAGPAYRVTETCTAANSFDVNIYVFRVADDGFSHVATVRDLSAYPTTRAAAVSAKLDCYRLATVVFNATTVKEAAAFAALTTIRAQSLCNEFQFAKDNFLGDGTPVTITTTSSLEA